MDRDRSGNGTDGAFEMTNPFLPGARVAIEVDGGYHAPTGYKEAFVDKAFKNGRFTLRDSKQQWRPYEPAGYTQYWHAGETGDHGYRSGDRLRIWDDAADAEIVEANATRRRHDRFTDLQREIDRLRFSSELVTDEVISHMQAVVLAVKPKPAETA